MRSQPRGGRGEPLRPRQLSLPPARLRPSPGGRSLPTAAPGRLGRPRRAPERGSRAPRAQTCPAEPRLPRGTPCCKPLATTPSPYRTRPHLSASPRTPGAPPGRRGEGRRRSLHHPAPRPPGVPAVRSRAGCWAASGTERAAGGAHGLPQVPARGDRRRHPGGRGLGEHSQESRGSRPAGGVRRGTPPPRGPWAHSVSPACSCTHASLATWAKFPPGCGPGGFVCDPTRCCLHPAGPASAATASGKERG